MFRILTIFVFVLGGCGTPTSQEVTTKSPTPAPASKSCVEECTRANQMRAVDHKLIIADCEQSCAAKGKALPAPTPAQ